MRNIFKIKHILVFFVIQTFWIGSLSHSFSKKENGKNKIDNPIIIDFDKEENMDKGKKFPKTLLPPDKIEEEYHESAFRRGEIIFFLSLPFIIGYELILNQIISSNAAINGQSKGSFSKHSLIYMGITSLALSSGVAYSDYLFVSEMKEKEKQMMQSVNLSNRTSRQFNLSWNFYF